MGAGFGLSKIFALDENTLTRVLTDFFMPALVFYSLYSSNIVFTETLRLLGATTVAVFLLILISVIYCRVSKTGIKVFAPSICFMNSGFLGIPLMALWGGTAAVNIEVIIDQMQTFYIFTLGIVMVSGGFNGRGLKEMIKTPLLWGYYFRVFLQIHRAQPSEGCGSGIQLQRRRRFRSGGFYGRLFHEQPQDSHKPASCRGPVFKICRRIFSRMAGFSSVRTLRRNKGSDDCCNQPSVGSFLLRAPSQIRSEYRTGRQYGSGLYRTRHSSYSACLYPCRNGLIYSQTDLPTQFAAPPPDGRIQ